MTFDLGLLRQGYGGQPPLRKLPILPVPLAQFLVSHTVSTSAREGWSRYQNSDLLNAAEAAGFDVLVTTDKNLRYQQNPTVRKIAIIVLLKQQWPDLRRQVHLAVAAIDAATPGAYTEVEIP